MAMAGGGECAAFLALQFRSSSSSSLLRQSLSPFSKSTLKSLFLCCAAPTHTSSSHTPTRRLGVVAATPARDRHLDFGKHKGKMLGTLPQSYLRWMAKSLKQTGAAFWAALAEEVLQDLYYQDRVEWEKLEQTLMKRETNSSRTQESLMRAYGWDLESGSAWRRVKFSRLGTSEGGRIPRVQDSPRQDAASEDQTATKATDLRGISSFSKSLKESENLSAEEEIVMSRRRMRRNRAVGCDAGKSDLAKKPELFPGRRALIRKLSKDPTPAA